MTLHEISNAPRLKTSGCRIIAARLLDSIREAETKMCLAMKHGVWAEPQGIRERHNSLNVSLDLIEDHVATLRTIIEQSEPEASNCGGHANAG
ncbi:MAG: hypothetical protein COA64_01280 [Henriciella sp.]|nr:MAG: hypothetical protein COA64_01280 [Henriciella sp.]